MGQQPNEIHLSLLPCTKLAVARPYFLEHKKEIKALPTLHQVSLNQLFAKNSYTRNITQNQVSGIN
jgi:hypothetical protein